MCRRIRLTGLAAGLLSACLGASTAAQSGAGVQSECQNEAAEYEIPLEQRADYVAGCVASRGGYLEMPADEMPAEQNGPVAGSDDGTEVAPEDTYADPYTATDQPYSDTDQP